MAKPSTLPRWAETAAGTPDANITEPSPGQKDTGWADAAEPPAEFFNWYQWLVYKWLQFLDTIFTSGGGIATPSNEHITVSGNGEFRHGDRQLCLSPVNSHFAANWDNTTNPEYAVSTGAGTLFTRIPLHVGERLKTIDIQRYGNGAADFVATLYRISGATVTALGDLTVTNPTASWGSNQLVLGVVGGVGSATPHTLVFGERFELYIVAGAAAIRIGTMTPTYDHP